MIDRFLDMEEENGLLLDSINGFSYWGYIRFDVFNRISSELYSYDTGKSVSNTIPSFKLKNIINTWLFKNPMYIKDEYDVLFLSHPRRSYDKESYRCLYTDSLSDCLNLKSLTAEFESQGLYPIYTSKYVDMSFVDLFPVICYHLIGKIKISSVDRLILEKAQLISQCVWDSFQYTLNRDDLYQILRKHYYYYKKRKAFLTTFLHRINPKVIVEVVGYKTEHQVINEVAQELGICTIELQHGMMGKEHIAYNYRENRSYTFLPQKMFLFSQYWKETCRYPLGNNNLVVTGFPYMEEQRLIYPALKSNDNIVRILVLSQCIYSKQLVDFTCDCMKAMDKLNIKYHIIYKLHPAEYDLSQEIWKCIADNPNVQYVNTRDIALYSLFANADIQIGVTSTALFEGLAYDLTTCIYHISDSEVHMGELCEKGYATMCDNAVDFIEVVKKHSHNKEAVNSDSKNFFDKDSLQKMKRLIESYVHMSG